MAVSPMDWHARYEIGVVAWCRVRLRVGVLQFDQSEVCELQLGSGFELGPTNAHNESINTGLNFHKETLGSSGELCYYWACTTISREIPCPASFRHFFPKIPFPKFIGSTIAQHGSPPSMRNSGFSTTVSYRNSYEEEEDDDSEFFDANEEECPEPTFVFKFEYQIREILKTLEKGDEIGDYVAFQAGKNSTSCFIEESQNGYAQNSSCDYIEANVHVEEGDQGFGDGAFEEEEVEKRIVIKENSVSDDEEEADVNNEVKFGSVVKEDMSHSDDSICSREDDNDELSALEGIGLRKPDGFDDKDDELSALEDIGLCKPNGFDDKDGSEDTLETSDTLEALCEHLKSIDKLKMELRKVRATTGDLESKHSLKLFSNYKSFAPAIKSFLSNLRLCRPKIDCDTIHSELEKIYVGQLCLSWEFLQWQYEKALETAPNQIHSYNEVAEELLQFRVLLQRFVEDEHFQGPRVENYVKSRNAMHKLLQVPEIREDRSKEGKEGNEVITDIVETLRESLRTMWRFIRADKNANITTACRKRSFPSGLDLELLGQVQADLRKKERMLKELKMSQNRIIKRFRKHEEEGDEDEESADHGHLSFFSQVDIKLVSRVLNMSTITQDQLVWCQSKLSKIHFVRRKVHEDPSFLWFPC
ncbi:hypothetical protein ACLB2K_064698 [Fragaria x ananassa]